MIFWIIFDILVLNVIIHFDELFRSLDAIKYFWRTADIEWKKNNKKSVKYVASQLVVQAKNL